MSQAQTVVVAVALLCLIGAGAGAAYAATDTAGSNPVSGLAAAIAAKFNLNTGDVQAVFDEQRSKMESQRRSQMVGMEAQRQQESKDVLAKAVAGGKLTQAQADLIAAKEGELSAAKKSLDGKTFQERRTAMQAQEKSLQQWLKDNNIPAGYLSCGAGAGRGVVGTVQAVSGNSITLVSQKMGADGETTYTVDAGAALIKKITKDTDQSGRPVESAINVGGIAVGDTIMVRGTVSGTNIDAITIVDGRKGYGRGMGSGDHGRGSGPKNW
ncbi:MAG: hypothetical protein MUD10_03450 [Candidatus Pacebacteria bacterium]|nr:hypothetical protein [Candidatus Paceibacterota bacterium]